MNLDDLEQIAFPSDHSVTLADLREFAYARKRGEVTLFNHINQHIESCSSCQRNLDLLMNTDPRLTGEDDRRTMV